MLTRVVVRAATCRLGTRVQFDLFPLLPRIVFGVGRGIPFLLNSIYILIIKEKKIGVALAQNYIGLEIHGPTGVVFWDSGLYRSYEFLALSDSASQS